MVTAGGKLALLDLSDGRSDPRGQQAWKNTFHKSAAQSALLSARSAVWVFLRSAAARVFPREREVEERRREGRGGAVGGRPESWSRSGMEAAPGAAAPGAAPGSRLERSSHSAFIRDNTLYVWGGYQVVAGQDVLLPSDEIWLCDLDSGTWEWKEISGDVPPDLSDACASNLNNTLYIFGGCDAAGGYSNQMFSVDVSQPCLSWKRVTDTKGKTPSPLNKHSCWVHRDRLIYFGGYGCKTMGEVQSTSSSSFVVEEMSWTTIGDTLFRCWGWNNEVNVFDTHSATWSTPATQGSAPAPRGCHASALLGNKGYVTGGVETAELDVFCLDLETWTWAQLDISSSCAPLGRSMHTMTPTSDHTLFVYGGLGSDGNTLNDGWQFNTLSREWARVAHAHKDKPRVCHTACPGSDSDVVVFGGSSNLCIRVDSMAVLRAPSQHHCKDVLIFPTQPYSLFRLCEDFIGRNPELFRRQLVWLPSKLHSKIKKRAAFFSTMKPDLTDLTA